MIIQTADPNGSCWTALRRTFLKGIISLQNQTKCTLTSIRQLGQWAIQVRIVQCYLDYHRLIQHCKFEF